MTDTLKVDGPLTLNGYPVVQIEYHHRCATVCVRQSPTSYVVATWWLDLGDSWMWGHYINVDEDEYVAENRAQEKFNEVSKRNQDR